MDIKDYSIEKRNGLVVVHRFGGDATYSFESAKTALANTIMRRSIYVTEEAHQKQVGLFSDIIAMFGEHGQAKGEK